MISKINVQRTAFISVPVLLLLVLVYMSGGNDSNALSAMQMPCQTIVGFGFFEEQIFLIAMIFLFGLISMSYFSEYKPKA